MRGEEPSPSAPLSSHWVEFQRRARRQGTASSANWRQGKQFRQLISSPLLVPAAISAQCVSRAPPSGRTSHRHKGSPTSDRRAAFLRDPVQTLGWGLERKLPVLGGTDELSRWYCCLTPCDSPQQPRCARSGRIKAGRLCWDADCPFHQGFNPWFVLCYINCFDLIKENGPWRF